MRAGGKTGAGSELRGCSLEDVREREWQLIRSRREQVGLDPDGSGAGPSAVTGKDAGECGPDNAIDRNLVGLSLSGGGVRSGAVSLGFLMGLHSSKLLRWVDYLSTVSGGGYAGALYTAEMQRQSDGRQGIRGAMGVERFFAPDTDRASASGMSAGEVASKGVQAGAVSRGSQALHRLRHLASRSNYLTQNDGWMSRASFGVLAMGTHIVSSLVLVLALLAYLLRSLYFPWSLDLLACLGFESDLEIPMMPALACFLLWLGCWFFSFVRHGRHALGQRAQQVFRLLLFVFVLGATMIATTGDIDVKELLGRKGISKQTWESWMEAGSWLKTLLLGVLGASLIPYFYPSALLRSGKETTTGRDKVLFILARNGLLFGVPLFLFGLLARENISGWNSERDFRLEYRDLLLSEVELDGLGVPELVRQLQLLTAAPEENSVSTGTDGRREAAVKLAKFLWCDEVKETWAKLERLNADLWVYHAGEYSDMELADGTILSSEHRAGRLERAVFAVASSFADRPQNRFSREYHYRQQRRRLEQLLMGQLNRRLASPQIYQLSKQLAAAELCDSKSDGPDPAAPVESAAKQNEKETTADPLTLKEALSCADSLYDSDLSRFGIPSSGSEQQPAALLDSSLLSLICSNTTIPWSCSLQNAGISEEEIRTKQASLQPLFQVLLPLAVETSTGLKVTPMEREVLLSAILQVNHQIVSAIFPGCLRRRTDTAEVFSSVVHTKDQAARWEILCICFWLALASGCLCDLNSISWHGFYAARLGRFWVRQEDLSREDYRVCDLTATGAGAPYPLINAALTLPGNPAVGDDRARDENPDEFLISPLYCGSDHSQIGFEETCSDSFSRLRLSDAIALSGSAVSPWATSNRLVKVLMLLLNLRTGLWLPRPRGRDSGQSVSLFDRLDSHFFPPLRWLALRFMVLPKFNFRPRPPETWSHMLVTDGGHYENLGLECLLRRRCRLIIAVDATEDPEYQFQGLAIVLNRMRSSENMDFQTLSGQPFGFPGAVIPDRVTRMSRDRMTAIRVRYPEAPEKPALILFVKSAVLSGDPLQLQHQLRTSSVFPHDPTSDQFFDAERFDAYRVLGQTAAEQLEKLLNRGDGDGTDSSEKSFVKKCLAEFLGIAPAAEPVTAAVSASESDSGLAGAEAKSEKDAGVVTACVQQLIVQLKEALADDGLAAETQATILQQLTEVRQLTRELPESILLDLDRDWSLSILVDFARDGRYRNLRAEVLETLEVILSKIERVYGRTVLLKELSILKDSSRPPLRKREKLSVELSMIRAGHGS